jgi:hypothetical protein
MPGGPRVAVRTRTAVLVGLVAALAGLVAAAFWVIGPHAAGLAIFSFVIAPTMAVLLTALAAARTAWRERGHLLRHGMGVRGLCAACGYDLRGQEPEEDGCRVCPECGAAWREEVAGAGPIVVAREP